MADLRRVAAAATARDLAVAAARGDPLPPLLADVMAVLRADAGVGLTRLNLAATASTCPSTCTGRGPSPPRWAVSQRRSPTSTLRS